jgi:hypothetical protein
MSLPSNGSTCHISSRIAYSSTVIYSFSEGCACDVCDWSRLSLPWLGSRAEYSPNASPPPSLRALVPSGSLTSCEPVQVYHHHPFSVWGGGARPPRCLYTHFSQPNGKLDRSLCYLQSDDLSESLIKYLLAPPTRLPSQSSVPCAIVSFKSRPTSLLERPYFRGSA